MTPHPIQPLETDEDGTLRFKSNAIVRYLLEHGLTDMNQLARMGFSTEDHAQFAQLIGYSWSGAQDLPYMPQEVLDAAHAKHVFGVAEEAARSAYLRRKLAEVKDQLRDGVARLYEVHPDDLKG